MKAINVSGVIKTFGSIPKLWNRGNGDILGYHLLNASVHYTDGFRDVIQPTFDPTTHKIEGAIYFDEVGDVFTYPVVEMTAQEQLDYAENQLNQDAVAQLLDKRKQDGVDGFDKVMKIIERKFQNGSFTANQAKQSIAILYPLIEPLYKGLWLVAKINMNNATNPTDAGVLVLFNQVKSKITDYLNNE
jgi:hypothetical protein